MQIEVWGLKYKMGPGFKVGKYKYPFPNTRLLYIDSFLHILKALFPSDSIFPFDVFHMTIRYSHKGNEGLPFSNI